MLEVEHERQINWTVSSQESLLSRGRDRRVIIRGLAGASLKDMVVELYGEGDEEPVETKASGSRPLDCSW